VKLLFSALVSAAVVAVVFAASTTSARVPPPVRLNALQLCLTGAIELVEERCRGSSCARQSVRLAWSRGEGTLYEGDSTGERALRAVSGSELSRLVAGLAALDPLETDRDQWCQGCSEAERVFTITTDCGGRAATSTFMSAHPVWQRVREAGGNCRGSDLQCLAVDAWHATFATHLASRFASSLGRLREAGRSN
jgi:hypothetical protein